MEIAVSKEQGRVSITVFEISGLINLGTASQLEQKADRLTSRGCAIC